MFTFTKKLTLALSMLALSSGQFVAFGSKHAHVEDDNTNKQLVVLDPTARDPSTDLPRDLMKLILTQASKHTNPGHLASVNKVWRNYMRENAPINPKLNPSNANKFMKACMDLYWNTRFYEGILRYTPKDGEAVIDLKFSDLTDPFCGTFDLSECGNRSQKVRITTSVEEFLKVRGENEDRLVVLACPYLAVEQAVNSMPGDHPFAKILAGWNKSKAPVGLFWRWGNWTDLSWVDCLTNESLASISKKSLYENWQKSERRGAMRVWCGDVGGSHFMLVFDKPRLGISDETTGKKPRV